MFTNATNKFRSLIMTGLAHVDGLKCAFKCACGWADHCDYEHQNFTVLLGLNQHFCFQYDNGIAG